MRSLPPSGNGFNRHAADIDQQADKKRSKETTMAVRVAINGFGRIGRLVMRAAYESGSDEIELVGINDRGPVEANEQPVKLATVPGARQSVGEEKSGS